MELLKHALRMCCVTESCVTESCGDWAVACCFIHIFTCFWMQTLNWTDHTVCNVSLLSTSKEAPRQLSIVLPEAYPHNASSL